MSSKRIVWLALAVLAVIAIAAWIATSRQGNQTTETYLYPQLKTAINSVNAIRIYKAGDERAVELVRGDQGWTVGERANYPADAVKIRKLLIDLQQARIFEEKTSTAASYPALGVEEVSDKSAHGVRLELAGTPQPINLIVGKTGSAGHLTYMRRAGEKPSWAINAELQVASDPAAWLQHDILDVHADRIQEAAVTHNGEAPFTVTKNTRAAADFAVSGIPKGTELNAPSAPNAVAASLAALSLEDIPAATALSAQPASEHATYKTFDGLVVEVQGWTHEGKRLIGVKTSYDPALAERFKVAAAAEPKEAAGKDAAKPAPVVSQPNVSDEAAALNKKLAGWFFQIPQYKYDAIFPKVDNWVKKTEPPKPAQANKPSPVKKAS